MHAVGGPLMWVHPGNLSSKLLTDILHLAAEVR